MDKIFCLIPIILVATGWLYFLTRLAPEVELEKETKLQFPGNLQELQDVAKLMSAYYSKNWYYVLVLFSSAYLYKQSFMIPGSVLLNVLGGALFDFTIAFPLVCFLTGVGASCCFLLAKTFGKDFIQKKFPNKITWLQQQVDQNKERLPYYLLFLRLFPMSPNWLINVLSPMAGIPLSLFALTATIGLMPYNFVCVHSGKMLASLKSLDDLFSFSTLVQMAILALVALGPSMLVKKTSFTQQAKHQKVE
ncbi:transmembrane protein 41A-A-like [Neocloeon triangulifer]|uniref:transmembrane protein 41A-A-like n=1 Tax=Neocloeon triangulifer TaxID=2078957 RepID=UPI00286F475F|nr:transmembrane protein 41A-A-like [Neocloeon triangulifer]